MTAVDPPGLAPPTDAPLTAWLAALLRRHDAIAGSVHTLVDGVLVLRAHVALPAPVVAAVATVPHGKGMAGLAWERDAPVQTCNLRTDTSGDVRAGARAVAARGAVALPVHDGAGAVRGVVGVAFADERVLAGDALERLRAEAEGLPA